jgi:hypothetical protein
MKPIREHLESIADTELREAALRNMETPNELVEGVCDAIHSGIYWAGSKEGFDFWNNIDIEYFYGNTPTYQQFKHLIK